MKHIWGRQLMGNQSSALKGCHSPATINTCRSDSLQITAATHYQGSQRTCIVDEDINRAPLVNGLLHQPGPYNGKLLQGFCRHIMGMTEVFEADQSHCFAP